jgi:hypothetical protein
MAGREVSFSDAQSSGSFTSVRSGSDRGLAAGVLSSLQSFRSKLYSSGSNASSNIVDDPHHLGSGMRGGSSSSFSREGLQQMLSAHSTISGTADDSTVTDGEGNFTGKSSRPRSIMGGASVTGQSTSKFWSVIGFHHQGSSASRHGGSAAGDAVVTGLRVRMGVATGVVPRNTTVARCALLELAKGEVPASHCLIEVPDDDQWRAACGKILGRSAAAQVNITTTTKVQ